eukprot:CAMPEP_0198219868 /NCGR_PEP_ID=MMETSP1445-20131203/76545_1 /TAXON_ID=36898 /ORGANISM="Pyramimonas sp., Strain CCMP2087" /LENGTH=114 /DNA_ID=CAMNT_0043897435 /DNA_START=257 /DNA_END=601 /DNA_ORIENTATION=-
MTPSSPTILGPSLSLVLSTGGSDSRICRLLLYVLMKRPHADSEVHHKWSAKRLKRSCTSMEVEGKKQSTFACWMLYTAKYHTCVQDVERCTTCCTLAYLMKRWAESSIITLNIE